MRDLLDKLDLLQEGKFLTPGEILKRPGRFEKVVKHIQSGGAFFTQDGEQVQIDPREAARMIAARDQDTFKGAYSVQDVNGTQWPISSFLKTSDFGGASVAPGQGNEQEVNKESALLKPSQIQITDRPIAGKELGKVLAANEILSSTVYGQAVQQMAQQIVSGQPAVIPAEFLKDKGLKTSIVDYAGEYLGVLAMVSGRSEWAGGAGKQAAFNKWLGGTVSDLTLNFPSKANTPLADSFAQVTNRATGHTVNISSKGTGGGAAPSMSGLKVPDTVRNNPDYSTVVRILDICSDKSLMKPTSVSQVFYVMNVLAESHGDKIPAVFRPFLPWRDQDIAMIIDNIKQKGAVPLPKKYAKIFADLRSSGSEGGKLTYETKKAVMAIINGGQVPEFQSAVLETLGMNFIQQYAEVDNKTGVMHFVTQWPAQLDGIVTVETKSGGSDPTKGGFSFKLRPSGTKPEQLPEPEDVDDPSQQDSKPSEKPGKKTPTVAAPNVVTGKRVSIKPPGTDSGAGRGKKDTAVRQKR